MKILAISDIHSNIEALKGVTQDRVVRDTEEVVCAGDLVGYYIHPNKVVSCIRDISSATVKGNHDFGVVNRDNNLSFNYYAKRSLDFNRRKLKECNISYLDELPLSRRIDISGVDIFVTHSSPKTPLRGYANEKKVTESFLDFSFDDKPDILILGHTHKPYVRRVSETLVVNPGSVGQPRDEDPRASFAIIDTEKIGARIYRTDYDIESVSSETQKYLPRKLADRLHLGR